MVWTRWERFLTNEAGDITPSRPVKVYTSLGTAAVIKGSLDGTVTKANSFNADAKGLAFFYAQGGLYTIVINEGQPDELVLPDVPIGSAQGFDVDDLSGDVIYTGVASGLRYAYSTMITAGDPGPGYWRGNNLTFASITQLRFDDTQLGGDNVSAWFDHLDDRATPNGRAMLRIENLYDPLEWAEFLVTGTVVNSTGYRTVTVTPWAQAGWPFANDVATAITSGIVGNPGADGRDPGVLMTWDTATTDANPAAGYIRANNAALGSAAFLYVSQTGRFGAPLLTWLNTFDDSTSTSVKGQLVLTDASTNAQSMFNVTGAVTVAAGYVKVPISDAGGVTSFTNGNPISVQFIRAGDAGNASVPVPFTLADRIVATVGAGTQMKQSGATADASGNVTAANIDASGSINIVGPGSSSRLNITDTAGGTDDKRWQVLASSSWFILRTLNDAGSAIAEAFRFTRSAASLTTLSFAVQLQEAGQRVLTIAGNLGLTGGFWTTSLSLGTITTGTVALSMSTRNVQHYNNNGAHAVTPPATHGSITVDVTNQASAGAITRSGFTKNTGDLIATTNGKKYRLFITVGDAGSHCHSQEMA